MTTHRDPGDGHRVRPPQATFLGAESSRFISEMLALTADDTVADDCAMGFLGELTEALWILDEIQEADENAFRHATRKTDHIGEFRRVIYRLHEVLADWEQEAAAVE
jgi:hypothetical protein